MVRSLGEATKELNRLVEKARKLLPLSRGGVDPNPQGGRKKRTPPKPLTRLPTSPTDRLGRVKSTLTEEQIRFKPQPMVNKLKLIAPRNRKKVTQVTRQEEDALQIELQDMFDQLPTEGQQELAYLTLRENNIMGEQDQTLENALARLGADRPRVFAEQFSRQNLVTSPKKKRKVSAYSKRFGIELKKLKKLHPRTKISALMKRAHRRTRSAMGTRKGQVRKTARRAFKK